MKAKATLLGHPIHQMMIVLPLGLLAMSTVFDVVAAIRPSPQLAAASFWNIVAGVAAGLVAAVFGVIDWTGIPSNTRAKRLGLLHAGSMVVVVGMFAASAILRIDNVGHAAGTPSLVLELVAFAIAGVGGWMGGELVNKLGIGVHEDAHADAPSSLASKSTTGDHGYRQHPPVGGSAGLAR